MIYSFVNLLYATKPLPLTIKARIKQNDIPFHKFPCDSADCIV